jgi:UDP-N-acetylglucosamine 2-epimerase (non-hydrolysing)/GDP/UDP-N,N'-diacetylbacillosamine 2-epimerase (hydrolysing)
MSTRRRICVVTGSRADYGLLFWLMKAIEGDRDLELQVAATGMHLSPEFGLTSREIEADGFRIAAKVEMLLSADTPVAIAKSLGLGVIGFADAFARLAPDVVVVLGDRFEILAAAQAALVARIPIAHIHGGEVSEHAIDESIRHAITKMAQWHFVAAEPYRKRVVQMGEAPERVFTSGAPGLDHLAKTEWLTRSDLEKKLGMRLGTPLLVVTYHPATLSTLAPEAAMAELLGALEEFSQATIVFTHPNADAGGRVLIRQIEDFAAAHAGRAKAFVSLGQRTYLSLVREADVVLGNSSSGLTEAPALRKATVNVGERQKGRLKATSVIDAAERRADIARALRQALSPQFRDALASTRSLYGMGDASGAILAQLKSDLPRVHKAFFDLSHEH